MYRYTEKITKKQPQALALLKLFWPDYKKRAKATFKTLARQLIGNKKGYQHSQFVN
jgi:hypothetical protein